jgi:hypothetical protein
MSATISKKRPQPIAAHASHPEEAMKARTTTKTRKPAHQSTTSTVPHPAPTTAATHAEEVAVTSPATPAGATAAPPGIAALAQAASAAIQQIAASLPFHDPSQKDLLAARVSSRVPIAAVSAAATILEQNPGRYPGFDAEATRGAADYATALLPVANQLQEVQQRLSRSIFNRHGAGAAETLALYEALKGFSRGSNGKVALAQRKSIGKLLVKSKPKPRATTVTQKDLKGAAKTARLSKVSAAKAREAAIMNAEAQLAAANHAAAVAGSEAIASASQSPPVAPAPAPANPTVDAPAPPAAPPAAR